MSASGALETADRRLTSTARVLKEAIQAAIDDNPWTPRYLRFPVGSYTGNGGIGVQERWEVIGPLFSTTDSG